MTTTHTVPLAGTGPRPARARGALLLAFLALLLLSLTACGGGASDGGGVASVEEGDTSGSGGTGGGGAEEDPAEQAQAFAACLRENGLDVPDPDPATGEIDFERAAQEAGGREALMTAYEACRDLAPPDLQDRPEPDEEQLDGMREFAACMRENGVDMPDPGPEGFGPEAVDPSAPGFDAALDACREFVEGFRGAEAP